VSDDASMMSQSSPVPVLFLAGIGRSGTTLIERTLAEVPGVTALGEVMHLWDRGLVRRELCGCGQPFLQCPFWSPIGQSAFGGWDNVDTDRMAYLKGRVDRVRRVPALAAGVPRPLMDEVDEYVAHFERIYRAAHDLVGGVLIDSSKQASLPWCLRRSPGIDLRVVHCVRDSRGVAASWAKATVRPEAVSAEHELMPQFSPARISTWWTVHNTAIEPLGRSLPTVRMRYEDFVRDPRRSTRRMLDLAGVESTMDHISERSVELRESHSCAGNPMRFRQGEIALKADERWREEMAPWARRTVTALTAPLLLHYGYSL
jgi:Sulfotransferase domain